MLIYFLFFDALRDVMLIERDQRTIGSLFNFQWYPSVLALF